MMDILWVEDFYVEVEGKLIFKGVNFMICKGEIYVLMGFNGLGKSMFGLVIMGYLNYEVMCGLIYLNDLDFLECDLDE